MNRFTSNTLAVASGRSYRFSLAVFASVFLAGMAVSLPAAAQSGPPPVSGVIENYFNVTESGDGFRSALQARWTQVRGAIAPKLFATMGTFNIGANSLLDENNLEYINGSHRARIGRFRSAFGQSDWSDTYYAGFVHQALMRNTAMAPGIRLNRLDTGFDYAVDAKNLTYQVGMVDVSPGPNEMVPSRANHMVARVQAYHGNLVIGLNGMANVSNPMGGGLKMFAVDWRWSIPTFQVRGEYVMAHSSGGEAAGHHVDLFYHPIGWTRTTFLGRLESAQSFSAGAKRMERYTVGIKQVLNPYLSVALTHGWGSRALRQDQRGWAMQLISFTRF